MTRRQTRIDRFFRGLSRGKKPEDFDPVQLAAGTRVEMEHTPYKFIAQRIAMDHLVEDPHYYVKLRRMESRSSTRRRRSR